MIGKIEWNDSYLLGIPEVDIQHKKLLKIANELYETATGEGENYKFKISMVLKELTDYTVYHFSFEEKFMRKYGYSGADVHKVSHDSFVSEVSAQIRKLTSGNKEDGLAFYKYIVNWVLVHIAKADRLWATFVKTKL